MKAGYGRYAVIGALIAAFIAAITHLRYVQSLQETTIVVMVRRELSQYQKMDPKDLILKQIPKLAAPPDALTALDQAMGQYARGHLVSGQVVQHSHLVSSPGSSMTAQLTVVQQDRTGQDVRAMALRTSLDTGVASTLRPGDEVDILVALKSEGANAGQKGGVAKIIAQQVPVLYTTIATDPQSSGFDTSAATEATVVLLVTPEQAEELAFAQTAGTIWLLTRPAGAETKLTDGVDMESFMRKHGIGTTANQTAAASTSGTSQGGTQR